ncbi:MAG: TIGR03936 family radical SAM-associated protein [Clostridia bacterium]
MQVIKYHKTGSWRFISHIEMLRHIERILRRADIDVKFSNGFNPHPLIYFSTPTVLGISSTAEYLSLDTDLKSEECLSRFNASVSLDMQAQACFETAKNPNLQGKIVAADYIFPTPFAGIEIGDSFVVEYEKKGEKFVENVRDRILDIYEAENGLLGLKLSSGIINLRADRVLDTLNKMFGLSMTLPNVKKVAQYVCLDNKFVDVDEYLKNYQNIV